MQGKDVGARIEHIRKELKFTRVQFAEQIGISSQYLGVIERGLRGFSADTLVSICKVTGTSSDYILFGSPEREDISSAAASFSGISLKQVRIAFEIMNKIAAFVNTSEGNEMLIQEVAKQQIHLAKLGEPD